MFKHADADTFTVLARSDPSKGMRIHLEISDDGKGFDPSTVRLGRGLTNIDRRSSAVGAVVRVDTAPDRRGTRIVLQWA